jgi:hypothetical protein
MPQYDWNPLKNPQLIRERGVCFEDVVAAINNGQLIDIINHPNQKKYPHQRVFIVSIHRYIHLVPFIEDKDKIFLKTIYPCRDATKKYLVKRK